VRGYTGLIFLVIPLLLLYMISSRSRRHQRVQAAVQSALRPGLRVMTSSGVHATIVSIDDSPGVVVLEIAPGVHTRWAKLAVAEVFDDDDAPSDDDLTSNDGLTSDNRLTSDDGPTTSGNDQDDRTRT
jgi:preprotein translocase subunit YajC